MTSRLARPFLLVLVLLASSLGASAQTAGGGTGVRVEFPLTPFQDTLFTSVEGSYRARFAPDGHVWYTTEGGLVHVDPYNKTRELFTKMEGLPSSYTLGLAIDGDRVYVGTDFGVAVIHRGTGQVQRIMQQNSPLPDSIVQEVAVIDGDVWMGTRFFGVAIWDADKPFTDPSAWTVKNTSTSTGYADPVKRIIEYPTAVYVGTEGDGLWRFDKASRTWNLTHNADGLPNSNAISVAERGREVWIGTDAGLYRRNLTLIGQPGEWTRFNRTHGMPDERVIDLDVIQNAQGGLDIFASTRRGVWQLDPATGNNVTRAQGFGILGAYVFDNEFNESQGWLFATNRGVSLRREANWSYFSSGPTSGPTWGPLSFGFSSASVGESNGFLFFGSARGISAYRLPSGDDPGYWQNFGEWQNYPGGTINWIDTEGNVTWIGTNAGTYGFEHDTGRWIDRVATASRNLVYGIEIDRGELWVALFGDGLIMENMTTGAVRTWDFNSPVNPLPDQYLTDVRVDGENVWLGAGVGIIRMDRLTGAIRGTYTRSDGIPGDGAVFRVVPEGPLVWVGTKNGGVAKFDVATGKVGRVWNESVSPGFPGGEVRSLHREGGRLWVGTTEGLAQIDVATGEYRTWNQTHSDLVQNYVNGISSADGILYLATMSGIARMEIATGTFLPMRDGPGVVRCDPCTGGGAGSGNVRVSVRIDTPRHGGAVAGMTTVRGSALAFGTPIDLVEVRIGNGEWQQAEGAESWSFSWDASTLPANQPVVIAARATAGNATGQAEISVTPVASPTVPLAVEEVVPQQAYANRPLQFAARAQGDEPLTVSLYYQKPGAQSYVRLALQRQGSLFVGTVPAKDMVEGEMRYYFEAQSGLLVATAPENPSNPLTLDVDPAPRLAVTVSGPPLVEATAGEPARFALDVTNAGTQPARFQLSASGLRAAWVALGEDEIALEPGETRSVNATLDVPRAAFADNTTLTFQARDTAGVADAATASIPIRILAAPAPATPTSTTSEPSKPVPLPALAPLVAAGAALLLRRRPS